MLARLRDRGFNPCCDGTDSSTAHVAYFPGDSNRVSILVVMERTHRPPPPPAPGPPMGDVSILVVMERTHRLARITSRPPRSWGFNPCCDGTDSSTGA